LEGLWSDRSDWYNYFFFLNSKRMCIVVGTDTYSTMAFILAIVFVAIANILLLNVLIALFK
jgi:hypothetical protein